MHMVFLLVTHISLECKHTVDYSYVYKPTAVRAYMIIDVKMIIKGYKYNTETYRTSIDY